MAPDSIRSLIREVLAEELSALRADVGAYAQTKPRPQIREEQVALDSDAELMDFVHRLLEIAKDGRARSEIEAGRWVFRLSGGSGVSSAVNAAAPSPSINDTARFDRGLISERQVDTLGANIKYLIIGKRVRFTPLARDVIRRRGIAIERMEQ